MRTAPTAFLAFASLIGLGFVLVLVGPSGLANAQVVGSPSASAIPPTSFCAQPVTSAYAHYPPITTLKGKITKVAATYGSMDATMTLDDGRVVTVRLSNGMLDVGLVAYRDKLPVEVGTHASQTCQIMNAQWIKV